MNTERLVNMLRELAPRATDHYSLATYNPESTRYRLTQNTAVEAGPIVDQLSDVLAQEEELRVFHEMPLRQTPGASWTGQFFHLARWMLAQARQRDATEVVRQLVEFIAANAIDALEVIPLWGLHPANEISLLQDIRLVPFATVDPSVAKDMLTGVRSAKYEDKNPFAWTPRPKAALVWSFRHGPIFNPLANGDRSWVERVPTVTQAAQMHEITRVLTLVRPSPVFPIAHWFQLPEGTPLIGGLGGWVGYESYRRFAKEIPAEDYDALAVRELVSRYLALGDDVRRRLYVPLERLRLAFLRGRPEIVALELGIALESLLTKEQDSEAPISYRLRLRATHLLGGGPKERQENADRFRLAYRLRSRAAHGESVNDASLRKSRWAGGSIGDFLRECTNRSAEMIRRIIFNGGFPDWEGLAMGWVDSRPY